MKKLMALLLSCGMLAGMLAACGGGTDTTSAGETPAPSTASEQGGAEEGGTAPVGDKAPADMTAEDWEALKNEERHLLIELLPNTFTDELWDILVDGFLEDHPNWTVELNLSAESADNMQAQILSGSPPVFFQPGLNFTATQGLEADILVSMEPVLNSPAYDEPGMTLRETLMPGFDRVAMKDGEAHAVAYRFGGNGVWYNAQMFRENGWEVPVTFAEFMDLCEEILAEGITPLMFTGTYAPYLYNMLLYPRICALQNGYQTSVDIANLKEGSWTNDATRQALEELADMMDKGYLPREGLGTDYLLAQQMFFEGKAAMVLSGTWLESEMLDSIPEGFEFAFMAPPVLENAGDTRMITAFSGGFYLCAGSGMELEAMEFVRYVLSNKFMSEYVVKIGEPVIAQTTAEFDASQFSFAAVSIYEAFNQENTAIIGTDVMAWYPELYTNFTNGVVGILAGNETIDNLLAATEQEIEAVLADDDIVKYVLE